MVHRKKNRKVDRGLYGLNCIWGPYSAQMVNSSTNEFVIIFQLKPFYDIKKKTCFGQMTSEQNMYYFF